MPKGVSIVSGQSHGGGWGFPLASAVLGEMSPCNPRAMTAASARYPAVLSLRLMACLLSKSLHRMNKRPIHTERPVIYKWCRAVTLYLTVRSSSTVDLRNVPPLLHQSDTLHVTIARALCKYRQEIAVSSGEDGRCRCVVATRVLESPGAWRPEEYTWLSAVRMASVWLGMLNDCGATSTRAAPIHSKILANSIRSAGKTLWRRNRERSITSLSIEI